MSEPRRAIDFGDSFTHMFKDPRWFMKLTMGVLYLILCVVLIGFPILAGYFRRQFLGLVRTDGHVLAEWDFEEDFRAGLPMIGAILCYVIPVVLLCAIPCIGWCLAAPLDLLVAFLLPAALTRLVTEDRFEAAFDFKWIFDYIGNNLGNYVLAFVIAILSQIFALLGIVLLIIGIFYTTFWSRLVAVHAFAEVYRASLPDGEAVPEGAPVP